MADIVISQEVEEATQGVNNLSINNGESNNEEPAGAGLGLTSEELTSALEEKAEMLKSGETAAQREAVVFFRKALSLGSSFAFAPCYTFD